MSYTGSSVVRCGSRDSGGRGGRVGEQVGLAGPAPRALAGHDDAGDDELPAPDAPRLAALEGTGEARLAQGAGDAEGLGGLDVGRRLGEPQVGVLRPARQGRAGRCGSRVGSAAVDRAVEAGKGVEVVGVRSWVAVTVVTVLCGCGVGRGLVGRGGRRPERREAADPVSGSAASRLLSVWVSDRCTSRSRTREIDGAGAGGGDLGGDGGDGHGGDGRAGGQTGPCAAVPGATKRSRTAVDGVPVAGVQVMEVIRVVATSSTSSVVERRRFRLRGR